MLRTVSASVSPFFTLDEAAEKFTTSALSRFSANSKLRRVRVLFSKNKLATVKSLKLGTFRMGRLMMSLNPLAVSKISSTSALVSPRMPNR